MGFGDEIMATGQARKVYDQDPSRRVAICDHAGRPRWHEVWLHNPVIALPETIRSQESVHVVTNDKFTRPYVQYPFTQDTGWRWTGWQARDYVGEIWLTDAEKVVGQQLRADLGPFVLIEPSTKHGSTVNKDWGLDRYQQVVSRLPHIPFVRVKHAHTVDPRPLRGGNVRELNGLTFREVVGILMAATAYAGAEGALHHAAAAVGTPAVVIFGGCVSVDALGYPEQTNIADTGPGSPCGSWLPCRHCEHALAGISVETVTTAVLSRWQEIHEPEMHVVSDPNAAGDSGLRDHSETDLREVRETPGAGDTVSGDHSHHRRTRKRKRTAQRA